MTLGDHDLRLEGNAVRSAGVVRACLALLAQATGGPTKLCTALALRWSRGKRTLGLHLHRQGRCKRFIGELFAFRREN